MITKAQELAILDDAIQAFGPHSYLGPWLASVRAEVESSLRADYLPELLPSQALATARAILATAEQQAAAIIDKAATDAERLRAIGASDAQRQRQYAVAALEAGLQALGAR
jgi:cell division septum initiation protein DivIVA